MLYTQPIQDPIIAIIRPVEEKPEIKTYVVKRGDTLQEIAREHNTSVLRLFYKNKAIKHPDLIKVGQRLVIPLKNEKLKARKFDTISGVTTRPRSLGNSPRSGGFSSSNLYDWHSCAWHVKNMRPDIPNSWGNATDWLYNAQRMGWATGSTPRANSIGWVYGHVVYIIKVSGNQVYLSERNWDWNGSYRERWSDASQYTFIY